MANRGEHSELLALLRVLHQGRIQVADASGVARSAWLKVTAVSHPACPRVRYQIAGDSVSILSGQVADGVVLRSRLAELADTLFSEIADARGASFDCPAANAAAALLGLVSQKAPSGAKADIYVQVASPVFEGESTELGFSIKSELGGLPTLLNAGATHFKYQVREPEGCDSIQVQEGLPRPDGKVYPGPMKLMPALKYVGADVVFEGVENPVFEQNLKMIDTAFPRMLASVLKFAYLEGEMSLGRLLGSQRLLDDLSGALGLPVPIVRRVLRHKMKDLLRQSALGMNPGRAWEGEVEAHGGWIVVKSDGQVVCFHLVNDDDFREYLLASCKLETPSMTRHEAGYVYRQSPESAAQLRLSLQVRLV